jgi:NAD(P)-dependent dehydrogenase (short-subunit alcohol dehydrogenase family)
MTLDPAQWSKTVRENVEAQFFPVRAFYSALRAAPGGGRIVCFSGGGATSARPGFSAYGAGKTAVVRMVETLAQEWGTEGPAINAIAPGVIRTEMTAQVIKLGSALAGEKEYRQALETWEKGGADLTKVLGLLDFLIGPDALALSGRLIAAQWDDWTSLKNPEKLGQLMRSEAYTLRRTIWNA